MAKKDSQIIKNSISEGLSDVWGQLSRNQRRFVVAMQECATKKEAAEAIGLEPDTIYRWPKIVDEAVILFSDDVKQSILGIIESAAGKAAMIKVAGLDSDDERYRQMSATEILDRVLGKAAQRQEITGADGGAMQVDATFRRALNKAYGGD